MPAPADTTDKAATLPHARGTLPRAVEGVRMSSLSRRGPFLLASALVVASGGATGAQTLGTFQWTLQPFCNVVTAAVTATETGYTLDGWDDQCGAGRKAPLVGQASANPDGTLSLGFYIVTAPVVKALAVEATVDPMTRAGTWRDSEGHTGTFAVGVMSGGTARPAAAALIGAAAIDPNEVQRRVSGACPAGQFFSGVNQDGSVACATPAGGGDITDVVAGPGLVGGSTTGTATLAVDFTALAPRNHDHADARSKPDRRWGSGDRVGTAQHGDRRQRHGRRDRVSGRKRRRRLRRPGRQCQRVR